MSTAKHPFPSIDASKLQPKIVGADFELTNLVEGQQNPTDEAADAILAEVDGVPAFRWLSHAEWKRPETATSAPRSTIETMVDRGRKYLMNGCIYIDSTHVELAFVETRSAADYVRAHRDMLRIAITALHEANLKRGADQGRIRLLAGNSDGQGNAWGTHLNFLISREAFTNIMLHYQAFLASVHAAGVIFGQGKVGAEFRQPIPYQLSQRVPDFFSKVATLDTMCGAHRGLVNTRDEALAGKKSDQIARYHCIPYDHTLNRYADWLKVGHLQLILLMIEAERVPCDLILEDPPQAAHDWGRDQTLFHRRNNRVGSQISGARARLITGEWITLAGYHARLAEMAGVFLAEVPELIDSLVPGAFAILDAWRETAHQIESRDLEWLRRRFDAWTKHDLLREAMRQNAELDDWAHPTLKALDHLFGELPDGLFFQLERAGEVEVMHPGENPEPGPFVAPSDTRAGVRARILGILPRSSIVRVNWDEVVFEHTDTGSGLTKVYSVTLSDPAMRLTRYWERLRDREDLVALFEQAPSDRGRESSPRPPQPPTPKQPTLQAPRCEVRTYSIHPGPKAGLKKKKNKKPNQNEP
jgi:hypothetical protein